MNRLKQQQQQQRNCSSKGTAHTASKHRQQSQSNSRCVRVYNGILLYSSIFTYLLMRCAHTPHKQINTQREEVFQKHSTERVFLIFQPPMIWVGRSIIFTKNKRARTNASARPRCFRRPIRWLEYCLPLFFAGIPHATQELQEEEIRVNVLKCEGRDRRVEKA